MLLWSVLEAVNNEVHGRETWLDPSFSIFIFTGSILLLLWLFGLTLYIFRERGIDFITLLELDHTSLATMRKPEDVIFDSATGLTLVYLIVFVVFNSALTGVFSSAANPWIAHSLPVFLLMFFVYRMLSPWTEDRVVWFSMLRRVAQAPLTIAVSFRDGMIADILTSLVRVFLSLFFSISYAVMLIVLATTSSDPDAVSTSHLSEVDRAVRSNSYFKFILLPVITLLPLKIRFVQCLYGAIDTGSRWPYFGNAMKYGIAIVVISQGLFDSSLQYHSSWLFALVFATMYQYVWDIIMDWGLIEFSARDVTVRLRGHRYLGPTWVYIAAMFVNLVLRFAWVLTLVPLDVTNTEVRSDGTPRKGDYVFIFDYLHPTITVLEIVRRMCWIWFRVEYEQIQTLGAPTLGSATISSAQLTVPSAPAASLVHGGAELSSPQRSSIEAMSLAAGLGGRTALQKVSYIDKIMLRLRDGKLMLFGRYDCVFRWTSPQPQKPPSSTLWTTRGAACMARPPMQMRKTAMVTMQPTVVRMRVWTLIVYSLCGLRISWYRWGFRWAMGADAGPGNPLVEIAYLQEPPKPS
jgi:hypothetical protein